MPGLHLPCSGLITPVLFLDLVFQIRAPPALPEERHVKRGLVGGHSHLECLPCSAYVAGYLRHAILFGVHKNPQIRPISPLDDEKKEAQTNWGTSWISWPISGGGEIRAAKATWLQSWRRHWWRRAMGRGGRQYSMSDFARLQGMNHSQQTGGRRSREDFADKTTMTTTTTPQEASSCFPVLQANSERHWGL